MAIADLIDNSIFAKARNVWVEYGWDDGNPWVSIRDDGTGMTEDQLREAMRVGSRSPLDERDAEDLGRFGLGLKTASFSQCQLVTVRSKTADGSVATRCWDLDHVIQSGKWQLGKGAPEDSECLLIKIADMESGTIVLWQGLDRLVDQFDPSAENAVNLFLRKFSEGVTRYLEMVFHRFLEATKDRLRIWVGRAECKPWDPFLRKNSFSQELSAERFENESVRIIPYVLPHVSKRSSTESEQGAGLLGWNSHQGFFVYRNKRMIVPGGYLDFPLKAEEHYKLARILVDIDNGLDHDWRIDIRKAVARPPDRLRGDLMRIAKATRNEAAKIYRARAGHTRSGPIGRGNQDVWKRTRMGEKISYRINTNNPVIADLLAEVDCSPSWSKKLFHTIESSLPCRVIIIDNANEEDCHVDVPPDKWMPPPELLELCEKFYWNEVSKGKSHPEAVDSVIGIEPFDTHPAFRARLDGISSEENHG